MLTKVHGVSLSLIVASSCFCASIGATCWQLTPASDPRLGEHLFGRGSREKEKRVRRTEEKDGLRSSRSRWVYAMWALKANDYYRSWYCLGLNIDHMAAWAKGQGDLSLVGCLAARILSLLPTAWPSLESRESCPILLGPKCVHGPFVLRSTYKVLGIRGLKKFPRT